MRLIDADALLTDIEKTIEESGCVNTVAFYKYCPECGQAIDWEVKE